MIHDKVPSPAAVPGRAVDDIFPGTIVVIGIVAADAAAVVAQIPQVEIGGGDVPGGMARFRAMDRALRKTSGPMTAEPKFRNTPPSRSATDWHMVRKSRPEASPMAEKSAVGC